MISLNGLFQSSKLLKNLYILQSTWPAPEHLRPVTLFFLPFLNAKPKHVEKYIKLYADFYQDHPRPLHVLLQVPSVMDFAVQFQTMSVVRRNLKLIGDSMDPADHLLIHGMSIGCFLAAVQLYCDKHDMFVGSRIRGTYRERIVGQVYDSPVYGGPARFGLPRMVDGMTEPISNPALKKVVGSIVHGYLGLASTRITEMDNHIKAFIDESPAVPTLAITSKEDRLCDVSLFEENAVGAWNQRIPDLRYHCFEEGPHARHIQNHPEIYKSLINDYLSRVQPILEVYDEVDLSREGGGEEEA